MQLITNVFFAIGSVECVRQEESERERDGFLINRNIPLEQGDVLAVKLSSDWSACSRK